ncbi:MAG: PD40 domain-containing protein [Sedimentisphaerales bacterium]|nr:PD40 domain-containing protein [Sedimentisphaerales bacterium]
MDGGSAEADFVFGEPINLGQPINTSSNEATFCLSSDDLEMYISSNRTGTYGIGDIWVSTRATINDNWTNPENLGPVVNSSFPDTVEYISPDGLELYFDAFNRPGGKGGWDIWRTVRVTRNDSWSAPTNLGTPFNTSNDDWRACISPDGLNFYFVSTRSGGYGGADIWAVCRQTTEEPWDQIVNLAQPINSSYDDSGPCIWRDGLTFIFQSTRSGGYGGFDLWMTTRRTIDDDWNVPVNLGSMVNTTSDEILPAISADGSILYFSSPRPGGQGAWDIYQAPIIPVVDLNDDAIVDAADMCIIVDHWGENYSLCDIGPMPWGDGVVDVQDLIVLAGHLFEGAGLVAHWTLDETEGDIAYDSAGNIDATVHNGQWSAGKIDGALDFDGLTTYMDCGDSLRLDTQKMTISMWLEPEHMGGMRYVLSRAREGAEDFDYVLMRQYEGQIEFAVAQDGSEPVSVMSNATTPLNEWTHVAVCLDGSEAAIYINGQFDASAGYGQRGSREDCRLWISSLGGSTRFYNGKIDDVRIYNIALSTEEIEQLVR